MDSSRFNHGGFPGATETLQKGGYPQCEGSGRNPTVQMLGQPTGYPLVMTNVAIENCHRNSGFSH